MEVVDKKLGQGGLRIHSGGLGMLGNVCSFILQSRVINLLFEGWIWPINVFCLTCTVFGGFVFYLNGVSSF